MLNRLRRMWKEVRDLIWGMKAFSRREWRTPLKTSVVINHSLGRGPNSEPPEYTAQTIPTRQRLSAILSKSKLQNAVSVLYQLSVPRMAINGLTMLPSSGIWRSVVHIWTDVSEERITSIRILRRHLFYTVSCPANFLPWRWRWHVTPKRRFTYNMELYPRR
jgi:hypothetical protein